MARDGSFSPQHEILGRRKHYKSPCNIWRQRGIYALYENFKIVYVGQADDRDIGQRLSEHGKGRLKKRWDSFSWFGVLAFDEQGEPIPYVATYSEQSEAIRSLELLAILMSDAPLNRQQGKFPGAEKVWQIEKAYLDEESDIDKKLDEILELLRPAKRARTRKA